LLVKFPVFIQISLGLAQPSRRFLEQSIRQRSLCDSQQGTIPTIETTISAFGWYWVFHSFKACIWQTGIILIDGRRRCKAETSLRQPRPRLCKQPAKY
jgi:hypothetical protein